MNNTREDLIMYLLIAATSAGALFGLGYLCNAVAHSILSPWFHFLSWYFKSYGRETAELFYLIFSLGLFCLHHNKLVTSFNKELGMFHREIEIKRMSWESTLERLQNSYNSLFIERDQTLLKLDKVQVENLDLNNQITSLQTEIEKLKNPVVFAENLKISEQSKSDAELLTHVKETMGV